MRNRFKVGLAACLFTQIALAEVTVSTLTQQFNGAGGVAVNENGDIFIADFGQTLSGPPGTIVTQVDPVTGALSVFANGLNGVPATALIRRATCSSRTFPPAPSAGSTPRVT